ncbi:MAG: aminoacyl-tRNA hydrolase [Minisyncoccia bacterium]
MDKIKLVYGLGNPQKEYSFTYHNIGRDFLLPYMKEKKEGKFSIYSNYKNLILGIGKVYMNDSGRAVEELRKIFKLKPNNILLIHDDADLEFLRIKISYNVGASMHKGVESIFKNLKTKKIYRLRVGIQYKKRKRAEEFILKKIERARLEALKKAIKKFKIFLDLLNEKPINKLSIPSNFFKDGNFS